LLYISCSFGSTIRQEFNAFKLKYNRSYKTADEEEYRFGIFQENMNKAVQLSELNPMATFGVNLYADISSTEFAQKYLMNNVDFKNHERLPNKKGSSRKPTSGIKCNPDPTNFDWSECNVITPVYNEGQCGSCWAISVSETIESYFAIAGYPLTMLSFEQIVDCDTSQEGCNGGYPTSAYPICHGIWWLRNF